MYCSHKQFIDIAKATGVAEQDLHDMLGTIYALVQRWGSLVKSPTLQGIITTEAPPIAHMIALLVRIDKLDVASLKSLLAELASDSHHFTVRAKKVSDALQQKLATQFGDVDISYASTDTAELQVAGDGWWYKRSLDKDLDKMLH